MPSRPSLIRGNILTAAANPGSPIAGDCYFNTGTKSIWVYDGSAWHDTAGVHAGSRVDTGSTAVTSGSAKTFINQNIDIPVNCYMAELTLTVLNLSAVAQQTNFWVVSLGGTNASPTGTGQRMTPSFTATTQFGQTFTVWVDNPASGAQNLTVSVGSMQSTGNMQVVVSPKFYVN